MLAFGWSNSRNPAGFAQKGEALFSGGCVGLSRESSFIAYRRITLATGQPFRGRRERGSYAPPAAWSGPHSCVQARNCYDPPPSMANTVDLATARRILRDDVLGPDEIGAVFEVTVQAPPLSYSLAELELAAQQGEALIFHIDRDAAGPLTLQRLIDRFPGAFDSRLLRKTGYQLKDEWGIELEPLAKTDTCTTGWILVRKQILNSTRNLAYEEQEAALAHDAAKKQIRVGVLRRRTAIEIAYDLILYHAARGERLLTQTWDWSSSRTLDAGYLNVGGFGPNGMQLLSYSPAVRHGALGVCPARLAMGN